MTAESNSMLQRVEAFRDLDTINLKLVVINEFHTFKVRRECKISRLGCEVMAKI
jgi:hypothetical protein